MERKDAAQTAILRTWMDGHIGSVLGTHIAGGYRCRDALREATRSRPKTGAGRPHRRNGFGPRHDGRDPQRRALQVDRC